MHIYIYIYIYTYIYIYKYVHTHMGLFRWHKVSGVRTQQKGTALSDAGVEARRRDFWHRVALL